ncbi:MAG: hypothetical protein EBT92_10270 [Planctomycetes bacterium]|nr:hypothetical protein [Planctomycetota bacterium]NBY02820.1 hypothetical protein [Planctomycetota bacterium]
MIDVLPAIKLYVKPIGFYCSMVFKCLLIWPSFLLITNFGFISRIPSLSERLVSATRAALVT